MPVNRIDRDKLRTAIRKAGDEYVLCLLDDAIDLLPQSKLNKLIKYYFHPEELKPDSPKRSLFDRIDLFQDASLRGEYYESFDVNWKNCSQQSMGTRAWISDCNRLLARLVTRSAKHKTAEMVVAFDTIFTLLNHIDEGHDDVIFFADEGGSWQVGVHWAMVFPAYFKCVAATVAPKHYAERVVSLIDQHEKHNRKKHLAASIRAATPAQKAVLKELESAEH